MIDHKHYTYRVTWSEEDREHIALCAEFPSLSYLADTPEKALTHILDIVKNICIDMVENNEELPEPFADKAYSGKFMVRVPPEQHRNLAIAAAEMGVSLNRHVSAKLG